MSDHQVNLDTKFRLSEAYKREQLIRDLLDAFKELNIILKSIDDRLAALENP